VAEPHIALGSLALVPITHDDSAWFDLGRWYRDRVAGELSRAPIAELTGLHKEAIDYDLVVGVGSNIIDPLHVPTYSEYTAHVDDLISYIGITPDRVDMIWFDWHTNMMGESLPTRLPAKGEAEFIQAVQDAQLAGYAVMHYTSSCIVGAGKPPHPPHP